jgi:hypothetical protein
MADVAILSAQTYTFDQRKIANWSTTQERQISTDYPFTITSLAEPIEQTVARTYIQFLWLPEASVIMTHYENQVKIFKKWFLTVDSATPYARTLTAANQTPFILRPQPHPFHTLLDPLMFTPRRTSNKFHLELPPNSRRSSQTGVGQVRWRRR